MDGPKRSARRMKTAAKSGRKAQTSKSGAAARSLSDTYVLRLYVTGMTQRSLQAISSIKAICDEYLTGRYDLEMIDIYQHPSLALGEQIIAAPTLIKKLPAPLRRLVGDLSDKQRVLLGLDLRKIPAS